MSEAWPAGVGVLRSALERVDREKVARAIAIAGRMSAGFSLMRSHMIEHRLAFVLGGWLLVAALGCASEPAPALTRPGAEDPLSAPPGMTLLMRVWARGDQIYEVKGTAGGFEWSAATPDAQLFDSKGVPVGTHGKGPHWTLADGGRVMAQLPPARKVTVDPGAVPWLELAARAGSGSLKDVAVIQRVRTTGGQPPKEGLDAAHAGTPVRVPYTAEYLFYGKPAASAEPLR